MLNFLYSDSAFIAVIIILFWIIAMILLALVPAHMAEQRGRSYWGWLIFSVLFSCFLGILFVAALGETDEHRKFRILEEEKWRKGLLANTSAPNKSASDRYSERH